MRGSRAPAACVMEARHPAAGQEAVAGAGTPASAPHHIPEDQPGRAGAVNLVAGGADMDIAYLLDLMESGSHVARGEFVAAVKVARGMGPTGAIISAVRGSTTAPAQVDGAPANGTAKEDPFPCGASAAASALAESKPKPDPTTVEELVALGYKQETDWWGEPAGCIGCLWAKDHDRRCPICGDRPTYF